MRSRVLGGTAAPKKKKTSFTFAVNDNEAASRREEGGRIPPAWLSGALARLSSFHPCLALISEETALPICCRGLKPRRSSRQMPESVPNPRTCNLACLIFEQDF